MSSSYLSGHFKVRNVLAHVRCDHREDSERKQVLLLQEVQSDWAQRARRAVSTGDLESEDEVPPPFMKEWPALAMKLVLLHAAHQELEAVAWTRGVHQEARHNGLGAASSRESYDHTLPREVNRMMKPFGRVCESLKVFVPTNFIIRQSENGYEVRTPEFLLMVFRPGAETVRRGQTRGSDGKSRYTKNTILCAFGRRNLLKRKSIHGHRCARPLRP